MARADITIEAIAKVLGVSRETAGKKLAKKAPIQLDEAFAIKNKLFPEKDICYLFSEVKDSSELSKVV
jgi:plasmid maintenance system antidote protein VapI